MSPFAAKWDPLVLLQIADEVLRTADAAQPQHATQRAYDAARATAGYPDSPRAAKLAERFGVPWTTFALAVIEAEHPAQALAKADYSREQDWRSETEIESAIQDAAAWLGQDHLNQESYEQARLALNARMNRAHLHGRALTRLPSVQAIRHRLDFTAAVEAAGLTVTPPRVISPMPRAEVVVLFIEHCGFVPTATQLRQFTGHHDIRVSGTNRERHSTAVEAAHAYFDAAGRWFPSRVQRTGPIDAGARIEQSSSAVRAASAKHPATKQTGYTFDELRAAIRTAWELLAPGQSMSAGSYATLAQHRPDLPGIGVIGATAKQHGTSWGVLVQEVAAERAHAMRRLPPS